MKKRIAFVTNPMTVGGVERALAALLNAINYDKYDVVLWTKQLGGEFDKLVNPNVEVRCWNTGASKQELENDLRHGRLLKVAKGLLYRILLRITSKDWVINEFYESKVQKICDETPYDAVIAYQGLYSGVVSTSLYRLNAPVKIAWIHGASSFNQKQSRFMEKQFQRFDHLFCVSEATKAEFCEKFQRVTEKITVFYNLLDEKDIMEKAQEPMDISMKPVSIVTVGRISKPKGQILIPKAARMLLDAGYSVYWYLVGDGEMRSQVEAEIEKYDVKDHVILLGTKLNPYPYIKNCDIYVQPSFSEGYCTTTVEAKILSKPIVVTNAPGMKEQFTNGKNGIIDEAMTSDAVFIGIKALLDAPQLCRKFEHNLAASSYANEEELKKLYALIDN